MLRLDHFVCGVVGLENWMKDFSERTGINPEFSGRHPSLGTHNALVSLDPGYYFELLAEEPNPPVPRQIELPHFKGLQDPTLICWYLGCDDFEEVEASLRPFSLKMSKVGRGSRIDQKGNLLQYEWVDIEGLDSLGVAVPSAVRWVPGVTHPAKTTPKGCHFEKLTITHEPHKEFRNWLKSLDLGIELKDGPAKIEVAMNTPKGRQVF